MTVIEKRKQLVGIVTDVDPKGELSHYCELLGKTHRK